MPDTITVRVESVRGRYPGHRTPLKGDTIDAFAIPSGPDEFLIRLDDNAHPAMWLELRITVRPKS